MQLDLMGFFVSDLFVVEIKVFIIVDRHTFESVHACCSLQAPYINLVQSAHHGQ